MKWHCTALVLSNHIPADQAVLGGVHFRWSGDDSIGEFVGAPMVALGRNVSTHSTVSGLRTNYRAEVDIEVPEMASLDAAEVEARRLGEQKIRTVLGVVGLITEGCGPEVEIVGCYSPELRKAYSPPTGGGFALFAPTSEIDLDQAGRVLELYVSDREFANAFDYWRDGWRYRREFPCVEQTFLAFAKSLESCADHLGKEFRSYQDASREEEEEGIVQTLSSELVALSPTPEKVSRILAAADRLSALHYRTLKRRVKLVGQQLSLPEKVIDGAMVTVDRRNDFSHPRMNAVSSEEDVARAEWVSREYLLGFHRHRQGKRT